MDDRAKVCLKGLVATHGAAVYADARRCEAFLRDLCPDARREIRVLAGAVQEGIPDDLLSSSRGEPIGLLVERLARRLSDNLALDRDAARWAVEAWASVFGLAAAAAAFAGPSPSSGASADPVPPPVQPKLSGGVSPAPGEPKQASTESSPPQRSTPWLRVVAFVVLLSLTALVLVLIVRFISSPPEPGGGKPGPLAPSQQSTNITRLARAAASSYCPSSSEFGSTFLPSNAIDGDRATAWIENAHNSAGIGEWLVLDFGRTVTVDSILVLPGYDKYAQDRIGDRYWRNCRVKSVRLDFDDGSSCTRTFDDKKVFQSVRVGGKRVRHVRLTILEVHTAGATDYDTAISEIEVWGKT
jgi:hypothetical protein